MKTSKIGSNRIGSYYRLSGYVTSLQRAANAKGCSIYPYLPYQAAINKKEGLKLCGVEQLQQVKVDAIEPISPIEEDDCYA